MDEGVDPVGRAMVPPDTTLALCLRGIFLELAVFAMDRSETFHCSELHPSRLLLLIANAAGEEACGVRRLVLPPWLAQSLR